MSDYESTDLESAASLARDDIDYGADYEEYDPMEDQYYKMERSVWDDLGLGEVYA